MLASSPFSPSPIPHTLPFLYTPFSTSTSFPTLNAFALCTQTPTHLSTLLSSPPSPPSLMPSPNLYTLCHFLHHSPFNLFLTPPPPPSPPYTSLANPSPEFHHEMNIAFPDPQNYPTSFAVREEHPQNSSKQTYINCGVVDKINKWNIKTSHTKNIRYPDQHEYRIF